MSQETVGAVIVAVPATIKTAQLALRSQGWIVGQQGKAVFVTENPPVGHEDQPD